MCAVVFLLLFHKHMWWLLCMASSSSFAESLPCAKTVEASPRSPWTVMTFRHLFVKVNDAYVRFLAQSLLPFAASNNFRWEVRRLYS